MNEFYIMWIISQQGWLFFLSGYSWFFLIQESKPAINVDNISHGSLLYRPLHSDMISIAQEMQAV